MLRTFLSSAALITLAACSNGIQPDVDANPEGNAGAACTDSVECRTPMSYLIRSSCPFTSMCIEGGCAVVCPMVTVHSNPEEAGTEPVQCASDTDCDCAEYAAGDIKRCSCAQGLCVAVVED